MMCSRSVWVGRPGDARLMTFPTHKACQRKNADHREHETKHLGDRRALFHKGFKESCGLRWPPICDHAKTVKVTYGRVIPVDVTGGRYVTWGSGIGVFPDPEGGAGHRWEGAQRHEKRGPWGPRDGVVQEG
ncbi:hypothetical protein ANT2_2886 [plant metagenome]|uniref:Uncharacterized protein n=1 Tax=plant metagenome TaxID=1297885 RepID=A0A484SGP6_9ZZZZ